MQNAKDTFYELLRGRLAALNPARTVVVRGIVRPGLLVVENEIISAAVTSDCFQLRWTKVDVANDGSLPLVTLRCEVAYETAGTGAGGGLDRGRCMEAMDAELMTATTAAPMRTGKMSFGGLANGGATVRLGSTVWWGTPAFGSLEMRGERMRRVTTIEVMALQEAGEM